MDPEQLKGVLDDVIQHAIRRSHSIGRNLSFESTITSWWNNLWEERLDGDPKDREQEARIAACAVVAHMFDINLTGATHASRGHGSE